jgi:hypothetical protein
MPTTAPPTDPQTRLKELLARPAQERLREYKYRFGQSIVFGIPVIALQWWGDRLGPIDSQRWSSLLQALLCGWVVYVNLGMLVEGLIDRRLRLRADFDVAMLCVVLFVISLISAVYGIITSRLWYPTFFHVVIILLACWSMWRWISLSRRAV